MKKKICGIYSISTPNGSHYVGSSTNIYQRWAEHRYQFRKGKHHSERLLNAYRKHGLLLRFEIIEECPADILNQREQFHIDRLGAKLNTSMFVVNVWSNPETRAKLKIIHASDSYRKMRREIARNNSVRWVGVTCSDGRVFKNMADAGRALGVTTTRIKQLTETQVTGKLGVRFRKTAEEWRPEKSPHERNIETRERNGTRHHSDATREKMRLAKVGYVPSNLALRKALEATVRPVVAKCIKTGAETKFASIRSAARALRPLNYKTATCQIVKACRGVKKMAYGYLWAYDSGLLESAVA